MTRDIKVPFSLTVRTNNRDERGELMSKIIGIILGGMAALMGIAILVANNCASVSLSGGEKRLAVVQCFSDSKGAVPAWAAGYGLIIVGVLLAFVSIRRDVEIDIIHKHE